MKVLVTGVNGFVGHHLASELVAAGHEVVGAGLGSVSPGLAEILADYLECDLVQGWPGVDVEAVVHLAALSAVGPSFADPQRYIAANSAPITHLGEFQLASGRQSRVVVVSTGAIYGANDGEPLSEASPMVPTSPYAVSKMLNEAQCAYYRRRGVDVVVMRPFNHIGPGQGPGFILPDLVAGLLEARQTGAVLRVGNLDTRRDYTDVRDVVRAYRLALESPTVGVPVLNVCSGQSVSGREILETAAEVLEQAVPTVEVDDKRLRPDDPLEVRGDNRGIRSTLGWSPTIALERSVRDFVQSMTQ